jgi:hypothetical protein
MTKTPKSSRKPRKAAAVLSSREKYLELSDAQDPAEYAGSLLADLLAVHPEVASRFEELRRNVVVNDLAGSGGLVTVGAPLNETERLAICLRWIVDSRLRKVSPELARYFAAGAARVYGEPPMPDERDESDGPW